MTDASATPVPRPDSGSSSRAPIEELANLVATIEAMPITSGPSGSPPAPPSKVDLRLLWARFSAAVAAHRHEEGIELAEAALRSVPDSRRWRLGLALALIGAERPAQALPIGMALFELWPDRTEIHRAIALAWLRLGNPDVAKAWAQLAERSSSSPEQAQLASALMKRVSLPGTSPAPPRTLKQSEIATGLIDIRHAHRRLVRDGGPAPTRDTGPVRLDSVLPNAKAMGRRSTLPWLVLLLVALIAATGWMLLRAG